MKKIYINAGHSDIDPGAVSYETERKLNVRVSDFMADYLKSNYDCEVRMSPGSEDHLAAVCKDANSWGADLFVSNHFNAGGGDGYECFVANNSRVPLGKIFEKHVLAAGQNSRGVKVKGYYVLINTYMAAILNEGAFVDNKKDIQDWNDDAELAKLGQAYAKAAAEFLGLKGKAAVPKQEAAPKQESYTLESFIRDVQKATGAAVDGIAGPETIGKTVTVSAKKNSTHAVVKPIQKRLYALGYTAVGDADGIAGPKFTAAVMDFQQDKHCWVDGELTAANKTWRCLLGME